MLTSRVEKLTYCCPVILHPMYVLTYRVVHRSDVLLSQGRAVVLYALTFLVDNRRINTVVIVFNRCTCWHFVYHISLCALPFRGRKLGDRKAMGRTITLASGLSVVLGIAMAAAFIRHAETVLSLMGAPPAVMGLAVPYLRWRALGFPANLFLLVASGTFRFASLLSLVFFSSGGVFRCCLCDM